MNTPPKPIRSVIIDDEPGNIVTLSELLREYCPDVQVLTSAQDIKRIPANPGNGAGCGFPGY